MKERGIRKKRTGIVISDKMDKTVVVEVERRFLDPVYKKILTHKKRYKAHDEKNECKEGDKVLIMETRPLSHDKRWRIVSIIEHINRLEKGLGIEDTAKEDIS
ncbi:30S ribosomal protein S17 [bacterium]|nr:30S ribosomal protein S17 [bacterium]